MYHRRTTHSVLHDAFSQAEVLKLAKRVSLRPFAQRRGQRLGVEAHEPHHSCVRGLCTGRLVDLWTGGRLDLISTFEDAARRRRRQFEGGHAVPTAATAARVTHESVTRAAPSRVGSHTCSCVARGHVRSNTLS